MKQQLIKKVNEYLVNVFEKDKKRLNHTHRVKEMALKLGEIHHVDLYKLELASLLHDFTKNDSMDDIIDLAKRKFSEEDLKGVPVGCLHAYSACVKAELVFGVEDQEILNAITYHCSGRVFKSKVEQVIFISDYIEESRMFVDESLRDMAKDDLDLVTYHILNFTINYLKSKNEDVSKLSKDALAYYKKKAEVINER